MKKPTRFPSLGENPVENWQRTPRVPFIQHSTAPVHLRRADSILPIGIVRRVCLPQRRLFPASDHYAVPQVWKQFSQ